MQQANKYVNGQIQYEQTGDQLTWYYKNGKVKAKGPYIHYMMEGEWTFYHQTGQLWQVANFKHNEKHGSWIRYDRNDQVEYRENFINNKKVKDWHFSYVYPIIQP